MTEEEYLKQLKSELRSLPPAEIEDILRDHREHFAAARAGGKTDAEIAFALGSARTLASGYVAHSLLSRADSADTSAHLGRTLFAVLRAVLILAPLNFFVLIGPFILTAVLLMVGWTLALATAVVGVAGLGAFIVSPGPRLMAILSQGSLIFLFLAVMGAGITATLSMVKVTHWFLMGALSYIKWNVRFVRTGAERSAA